jgi:hypothetical protein
MLEMSGEVKQSQAESMSLRTAATQQDQEMFRLRDSQSICTSFLTHVAIGGVQSKDTTIQVRQQARYDVHLQDIESRASIRAAGFAAVVLTFTPLFLSHIMLVMFCAIVLISSLDECQIERLLSHPHDCNARKAALARYRLVTPRIEIIPQLQQLLNQIKCHEIYDTEEFECYNDPAHLKVVIYQPQKSATSAIYLEKWAWPPLQRQPPSLSTSRIQPFVDELIVYSYLFLELAGTLYFAIGTPYAAITHSLIPPMSKLYVSYD